jgi:hypothetical protein
MLRRIVIAAAVLLVILMIATIGLDVFEIRMLDHRDRGRVSEDDRASVGARCVWHDRLSDVLERRLRGKALFNFVNDGGAHRLALYDLSRNWPQMVRFFFVPQHIDVLLAFDRHMYSGVKARYLEVVDTLKIVPADDGTRAIVERDRAAVSAAAWADYSWKTDDAGPTLNFSASCNETSRSVAVEIVHFHLPIQRNVPGLFVEEVDHELVWTYNGTREPAHCATPHMSYPRGTGAYASDVVWTLPELQPQNTDYVFKIDFDIQPIGLFPFNIMEDMWARGGLFAHSGQYCDGDQSCSLGFESAKRAIVERLGQGYCATGQEFDAARGDLFYTNFIVLRTRLFTHPSAIAFMRELWRDSGWWLYRWSDQIALHHVLGLLVGDAFRHVVDYSQFRCTYREYVAADEAWWRPQIWYNLQPEHNSSFQDHCAGATFHHGRLQYDWHSPPGLRQTRPANWEREPNTQHVRIWALQPAMCKNARFK